MVSGDGSSHGTQAPALCDVPQDQHQQGPVQEARHSNLLSLLTGAGQPPDGVGGAQHRTVQPPHHRHRSLPRFQRPPHDPLLLSHHVRPSHPKPIVFKDKYFAGIMLRAVYSRWDRIISN